jgi:predicted TIM-barrel fold metal-dependent hydrolase
VVVYASDYPHEPKDEIVEEVDGLIGRSDLSESSKRKILRDNTIRFYNLKN